MSLLGAILIDPQVIGETLSIVRSGRDFFKPANGAIYDAMLSLYNDRGAIDIVQLNQMLLDRGTLEAVGGVQYLVELAQAVPSAASAAPSAGGSSAHPGGASSQRLAGLTSRCIKPRAWAAASPAAA